MPKTFLRSFTSLFQRTAQETQTPATSTAGAVTSTHPKRMFGMSKTMVVSVALAIVLVMSAGIATPSYAGIIKKTEDGYFRTEDGDKNTHSGYSTSFGGESINPWAWQNGQTRSLGLSLNELKESWGYAKIQGPETMYAGLTDPSNNDGQYIFEAQAIDGKTPSFHVYAQMKADGSGLEDKYDVVWYEPDPNSKLRAYVAHFAKNEYDKLRLVEDNEFSFARYPHNPRVPLTTGYPEDLEVVERIIKGFKGFLNVLGREQNIADGILKVTRAPDLEQLKSSKRIEAGEYTTFGEYLAPFDFEIDLTIPSYGHDIGQDIPIIEAGTLHEMAIKIKDGKMDVIQAFHRSGLPDFQMHGLDIEELKRIEALPMDKYDEYDEYKGNFIKKLFWKNRKEMRPEWKAYFLGIARPLHNNVTAEEARKGKHGIIRDSMYDFQDSFVQEAGNYFFESILEKVKRLNDLDNGTANPKEVLDYNSPKGTLALQTAYLAQEMAEMKAKDNQPGFFKRVFRNPVKKAYEESGFSLPTRSKKNAPRTPNPEHGNK